MDKKDDRIVVKRPARTPKDKIISLRTTEEEKGSIDETKKELSFKSIRNLFLFCIRVVKQLYNWHVQGYSFFIKKGDEKDYKEVEFEFQPDTEES